jgi:hypothetical protein
MLNRLARLRDAVSTQAAWTLALALTAAALFATALLPRIAQPQGYHSFADERALLGIPYALNVLSNLPFLLVGVAGLWWIAQRADARHFRDPRERWAAMALFAGLVTTFLGSSYYHLNPSNQTLVFDRLGMIFGFGALLPMAFSERVSAKWGARLLVPSIAIGLGTVLYWNWSEMQGAGDLRWYGFYQGYAFLATAAVLLLTRSVYDRQSGWLLAISCYGFAKVFELLDHGAYNATGHAISGHSLKHVIAAVGGIFVLRMLQQRRLVGASAEENDVDETPELAGAVG